MKKAVAILMFLGSISLSHASTWGISEAGYCDGATCWDISSVTVTVSAGPTVPANSTINVAVTRNVAQKVYPNQHGQVLVAMGSNWNKECSGSGCDYDAFTYVSAGDGSGGNPTAVSSGLSSGSVNINVGSPSSNGIDISTQTAGISCEYFSVGPDGESCNMEGSSNNIPLTVTSAASVNLNISGFLKRIFTDLSDTVLKTVFAAN